MSAINRSILGTSFLSEEKQLRRLVLANMLFEDQFYLDGQSSAGLIKTLVPKVAAEKVQKLAIEAREKFHLRHVPLLLARELARIGKLPHEVLTTIIQRPDEMGEFLAIYWAEGKTPIANQIRKGLANCFHKFSEYSLAKWDKRSAAIRIRDVMFLTHPMPTSVEQAALFERIAKDTLQTPDTWEVALSGGANKAEVFTRLMKKRSLCGLAYLRNLRNMVEAQVPANLIEQYGESISFNRVLPFRFIAAAQAAPVFKPMLEKQMLKSMEGMNKLGGRTALLVDVSGSMFGTKVSSKSDLDRFDAAAALAMMCRELCENVEVFTFSSRLVRISNNARGFALHKALFDSQSHGSTQLSKALSELPAQYDRVIVFTDEQSQDGARLGKNAGSKSYLINVAAYKQGIEHSSWVNISGFSEAVFEYIYELENE